MPAGGRIAERDSILRRSASAYLYSPSPVYLAGSCLGIVAATLILLALGGRI
jgi:hypothetical protein